MRKIDEQIETSVGGNREGYVETEQIGNQLDSFYSENESQIPATGTMRLTTHFQNQKVNDTQTHMQRHIRSVCICT